MAINPENIDTTDLSKLDTATLALTNYFAHSLPNGFLQKSTIANLATFLAPYVSSIGGSGYVLVNSNELPNPTDLDSGFSLVGSGTFTQTTGSDIITTEVLNILNWNGTTWSLAFAIPVNLLNYATSAQVFGENFITNPEFSNNHEFWASNGIGSIENKTDSGDVVLDFKTLGTINAGFINSVSIDINKKYLLQMDIKPISIVDGVLNVSGTNIIVKNNPEYQFFSFILSSSDTSNISFVKTSAATEEYYFKNVKLIDLDNSVYADIEKLKIASSILDARIAKTNIIKNGYFFDGIDGWIANISNTISEVEDYGTKSVLWKSNGGYDTAFLTSPDILIPKGVYVLDILIKVTLAGDKKFAYEFGDGRKYFDLIDNGDYNLYSFVVNFYQDYNRVVLWNGNQVAQNQNIILKYVNLYKNDSITSSRIDIDKIKDNRGEFDVKSFLPYIMFPNKVVHPEYVNFVHTNYLDVKRGDVISFKVGAGAKESESLNEPIALIMDSGKTVIDTVYSSVTNSVVESTINIAENGFVVVNNRTEAASDTYITINKGDVAFATKDDLSKSTESVRYIFPSDYMHILDYGQSNSEGADAAITTSVFDENILIFNEPVNTGFRPFAFISGYGEGPRGGSATAFHEITFSRGIDISKSKLIFSKEGVGGAGILSLIKGTSAYDNLIAHVTTAFGIAESEGKTYSVPFVQWTHGEANVENMTIADYKSYLIQLKVDLNTDIKAITGQDTEISFVMNQISSFNSVNYTVKNSSFPMLFVDLANEVDGFYFSNPAYYAEYLPQIGAGDYIHYKAPYSKLIGAEYMVIIDKILSGKEYKKLALISHSFKGKIINLIFNKKLVLDTTNVNSISGYGFLVSGNPITSVSVNDNRVTIVCQNDLIDNDELSYAYNAYDISGKDAGPRGNIRSEDEYVFSFGTVYDWYPHYKITL